MLFLEPKKGDKSTIPIDDKLTNAMETALKEAEKGTASYSDLKDNGEDFSPGGAWRGWHITDCGENSDNVEYRLSNGLITNSLAPYYLRWYRDIIPQSEIKKAMTIFD